MATSSERKTKRNPQQRSATSSKTGRRDSVERKPVEATQVFPDLEWEKKAPPRPTNRQRLLLGIALGVFIAWFAALVWLALDNVR